VVEASPAWPWLYDLLADSTARFVLAHPKKLRAIAEANYKSEAIDATLLAQLRLAQLIPEVHCKPTEQRELAVLVRHRARLVLLRTVPGIGPYRALTIIAEADPITRLRTPNHLVSYAGLAPRPARSGMKVRYGPIPEGANRSLAAQRVRASGAQASHEYAGQLAVQIPRSTETTPRLARSSHRHGAQACPGGARHASHR
jgi:transposase